jgi:hypothetical protein
MRGTPPIQRRPVTDALRASIVEDLPEIKDIKDAELRAKVIEGWAFSLAGSSYQRISDLPGEGNPDVLVLKRGNQTDHLRGVAHFAGSAPSATSCAMPTTPGGTSRARSACSSPRRWSMSAR